MDRAEVRELHYITHIDNVPSILDRGILAHNEVERSRIQHVSVAMAEIQARRSKQIPGGRRLHDYANLYFNARNPMMFKRARGSAPGHAALAVIRVNQAVLDLPGVIVADKNASSEYVSYHPAPDGISSLDSNLVFAERWTSDDPIDGFRRKSAICAEVLVPARVEARQVTGVYVSCEDSLSALRARTGAWSGLDIAINRHIFFL